MGIGSSPSNHAIRNQKREWVKAALEGLAGDDRRVLKLRYVEDLSFAEIADQLELGAVKMRHRRALERLRGRLDGRIEEF
jgi:RNA polymerase sigma factor (sigma-70 family)